MTLIDMIGWCELIGTPNLTDGPLDIMVFNRVT